MVKYFKNKYIITLSVFICWILFFDEASVLDWLAQRSENKNISGEIEFYNAEYVKLNFLLRDMQRNNDTLEMYVRESFYMKKNDETIFLIE